MPPPPWLDVLRIFARPPECPSAEEVLGQNSASRVTNKSNDTNNVDGDDNVMETRWMGRGSTRRGGEGGVEER